jgi:hypothetical protein
MRLKFKTLLTAIILGLCWFVPVNSQTRINAPDIGLKTDSILVVGAERQAKNVPLSTLKTWLGEEFITLNNLPPALNPLPLNYSVIWTNSGLVFDATALRYYIVDTYYTATAGQITLDTADATNDRIDLIVADTSGVISKITGTPSASPAEPNYNLSTQFPLKFILVSAGGTVPNGVSNTLVYDEDLGFLGGEWDSENTLSSLPYSGIAGDYASTDFAYSGTKSTKLSLNNNDYASWSSSTGITITDINAITFWIKLPTNMTGKNFSIIANLSNQEISTTGYVWAWTSVDTQSGIDLTSTDWQEYTFPFIGYKSVSESSFGIGFTMKSFNIIFAESSGLVADIYLDKLEIQTDESAPATPTTDSYAPLSHISNYTNPHNVTKEQVGLANTSGTNTGDQDLSGYLLNTTDTLDGTLTVAGVLEVKSDITGTIAKIQNENNEEYFSVSQSATDKPTIAFGDLDDQYGTRFELNVDSEVINLYTPGIIKLGDNGFGNSTMFTIDDVSNTFKFKNGSLNAGDGLNEIALNVKDAADGGNPDNYVIGLDNVGQGTFYAKLLELGDAEGVENGTNLSINSTGGNFKFENGNVLINTPTDNGTDKLQVNGSYYQVTEGGTMWSITDTDQSVITALQSDWIGGDNSFTMSFDGGTTYDHLIGMKIEGSDKDIYIGDGVDKVRLGAGTSINGDLTVTGDVTAVNGNFSGDVSAEFLEISKSDQTNGATLSITNAFDGSGWDSGDNVGTINFKIDDGSASEKIRGQIKVFDTAASSSTYPYANAMSFSTANLNTLTEALRLNSDQTATFANDVDITGDVTAVDGTLTGRLILSDALTNSFIGFQTGTSNTTGSGSVGLGFQTLFSNDAGNWNVAIGLQSMIANEGGSYNTALNRYSLGTNIDGDHNIGVGYQSGTYITNGVSSNTAPSNSIFIGNSTRAAADSQTNQIVIGDTAIGNGSNTVTLGNDSITDTYLKGDVNIGDNLVIGSSAPDTKLVIEDVTKALNANIAGTSQGTLSLVSSDAIAADIGASLLFGGKYIAGSDTKIAYGAITGRKSHASTLNGDGYLGFYTWKTTGMTEKMRINDVGSVLFGTTGTPDGSSYYGSGFVPYLNDRNILYQSSSDTGNMALQIFSNPNGIVGNINTTGSSTNYVTSSDYRLKEDLQDFDGLEMISNISVYDYKWKVDDSRSFGVMAHELQEVLPSAVSGVKDETEDYVITPAILDLEGNVSQEAVTATRDVSQGVDYSKIVPLLIKSIQQLKAEIELLKNE